MPVQSDTLQKMLSQVEQLSANANQLLDTLTPGTQEYAEVSAALVELRDAMERITAALTEIEDIQ